ncbi:MAG TPA: hypothetical protein VJJ78_02325 [Candidatus Saccharimonadales bacterium]|nr:hypothetical protein [Candidatus Saccharimonadales bacterium]
MGLIGTAKRLPAKWLKIGYTALLFSGTILVAALVLYLALGGGTAKESEYVKANQYQAVFLGNGQVYFGRVTSLTNKFARIQDIFYLKQNQAVQNQKQSDNNANLILTKLGCELHGPDDEMLINREQLIFWENLKSDGAVVKKIAEFKEQNPNGQKCSTTTEETQPRTNQSDTTDTTAPTNAQ